MKQYPKTSLYRHHSGRNSHRLVRSRDLDEFCEPDMADRDRLHGSRGARQEPTYAVQQNLL